MKINNKQIFVVVGSISDGDPFEPLYLRSCTAAFTTEKDAKAYIKTQKLTRPTKNEYTDSTDNYKGGYYNLEIEVVEVKS
jgi:hypothetical protein